MNKKKFNIEVFPAYRGDCFLIHCNNGSDSTNLLIDTGFSSTAEILKRRLKQKSDISKIDLLIITHIDDDHISGAFNLLTENGFSNKPGIIPIESVWHNSYRHLFNVNSEPLELTNEQIEILEAVKREVLKNDTFKNEYSGKSISSKQGSSLGELFLKFGYNWNKHSAGKAISIENCPERVMINDVAITIISPNNQKLMDLKSEWISELISSGIINEENKDKYIDDAFEFFKFKNKENIKNAGLNISSEYKKIEDYLEEYKEIEEDSSETNGSSIAFILEFAGKKALFLGDAHPSLIAEQIFNIYQYKPVKFDFIKVSHHGSRKNMLFRKENILFNLTDFAIADKYLFSTNGKKHNHPDCFTLAKIISSNKDLSKKLYFNYETFNSKIFNKNREWKDNYKYSTEYVDTNTPIELI